MAYLVQMPEDELKVGSEADVTEVLRDYLQRHPDDPQLANVAVHRLPVLGLGSREQLAPHDFLPQQPHGEQHPPYGAPEDATTVDQGR